MAIAIIPRLKQVIISILILCSCITLHAQTTWELKKDKDGIKVYTGMLPNSTIKAVRVICTVNASLSQLTGLLRDVKAHEQWVYGTKTSYLVKQLGPGHIVYYSELSVPWPFTNRDVVIDINITQQPLTKTVFVAAATANSYVPVKKDKVRVLISKSSWTIIPITPNQLSIDYIAQADPAGSVPEWITNLFCTKGPYETFKKLRELVAQPQYKRGQYTFIKD
jgi:START domain